MNSEEAKMVVAVDPWKACDLAAESVERGTDDWRLMVKYGLINKITANIGNTQDSSFLRQILFGLINNDGAIREIKKSTMEMFLFIGVRMDGRAKADLLSSVNHERVLDSVRWFEERGLVGCEEWLSAKQSPGVAPQNVAAIQAMVALKAISSIQVVADQKAAP